MSLAYVACYVALDWVSTVFPVSGATFTAWNPPPGLSLVFLLRNGVRRWPWLFAAALAAVASTGGSLYVPRGTYTITSTQILDGKSNIRIFDRSYGAALGKEATFRLDDETLGKGFRFEQYLVVRTHYSPFDSLV